jgi:hypothetical protein
METITLNNGVDMPARWGSGCSKHHRGELSLVKIGRCSFVQAEELDQHVLQAVSNVILEVSACRNNVSDQAEAIASKLADRVQSG